jgi:hypothetical protein
MFGLTLMLAADHGNAQGVQPPLITYSSSQSGDVFFMAEPAMQLDLVAVEPLEGTGDRGFRFPLLLRLFLSPPRD